MKSSAHKANAHLRRDLKNEERSKRRWVSSLLIGRNIYYEMADPPAED